jgi:hypothetical protein
MDEVMGVPSMRTFCTWLARRRKGTRFALARGLPQTLHKDGLGQARDDVAILAREMLKLHRMVFLDWVVLRNSAVARAVAPGAS